MSEQVTIDPSQLYSLDSNADNMFDFLNLDDIHPYLSEPPSLSPSSQSSFLRPHSPSTASPRSILSTSDDANHTFTPAELDQLFAQQVDAKHTFNGFYLPSANSAPGMPVMDPATVYPNLYAQDWLSQPLQKVPLKNETTSARKRLIREDSEGYERRPVGKHNKTERRYRQKVQEAQSNLRDAVPALRVLYGTSTDEQKRTTDVRASDGTVDGVGEFNRPNASAKTTIFIGARLYIEHLQRKVATLQRQVDELAAFRAAVAGPENLQQWRADFEVREAVHKAAVRTADDSYDDDSEDEKPKKKLRVSKKTARSFAAFAAAFALVPFMRSSTSAVHHLEIQSASPSQVVRRLPIIVVQHVVKLLESFLPPALASSSSSMVEWTAGVILAIMVVTFMRFLWNATAAHWIFTQWSTRVPSASPKMEYSSLSVEKAVGKVWRPSSFQRYHLALHLSPSARDAKDLALLALFQPALPLLRTSVDLWASAKAALVSESPRPLRQVLALDLAEAKRALELLPPTIDPITAIAEQITLVHLNDLFSRFFVQLVDNATGRTIVPASIQSLQANIRQRMMGKDLSSSHYDKEVRAIMEITSCGTAARALALVLVGLWGVVAGAAPSAQASLASALAGEEVRGVGASLVSVGELRELLYPGSGMIKPALAALPGNALAIDKLALVCVRFLRLLSMTADENVAWRSEKLDLSNGVEKSAMQIRLVLAETTFAGMNEEASMDLFDDARDRLVTVLSLVGRGGRRRAGMSSMTEF